MVVAISPAVPAGTGLGAPIFLYARVRYEFKPSSSVPGKVGLYRTQILANGAESSEELVAPFANTAKWRFFVVGNNTDAQDNPPAQLTDIRGLELHFDGVSEYAAIGVTSSESAPFTTAVFFKNRID
jgi:hypothetical protein